MKKHLRFLTFILLFALLSLLLFACGEKDPASNGTGDETQNEDTTPVFAADDPDNIEKMFRTMDSAENYTMSMTISGDDTSIGIDTSFITQVTENLIYEESPFYVSYTVIGDESVTVYQYTDGEYQVADTYTRAEYDAMNNSGTGEEGGDVDFAVFLSKDNWVWDAEKEAFIAQDVSVFDSLGFTVSEMQLTFTEDSFTLLGIGTMDVAGYYSFDISYSIKVDHIGTTTVTLPPEISESES